MEIKRLKSAVYGFGNALVLVGCSVGVAPTAGCNDPVDDDSAAGDDDDAPACSMIAETKPAADSSDFFYQDELSVTFNTQPAETVTLTLTDGGGNTIAGTTTPSPNGRTHTFDPSADLMPDTSYALTIDWGCNSAGPLNFRTSTHGSAVADDTLIIGKSYFLDLTSAEFVEPPGVGGILASQLGDVIVLFSPMPESDIANGELHIVGALGEDDGTGTYRQDLCNESLPFTFGNDGIVGTADDEPAAWDNPFMSLEAPVLSLTIQDVTASIQDLLISGTFAPDLSGMAGGTFGGMLDTRALDGLIGDGTPGAACELVEETIGVPCEECGGGNPGAFCLTVLAEDIIAVEVPGTTVVQNDCDDILLNAACEEDWADCGAVGDDDDSAGN